MNVVRESTFNEITEAYKDWLMELQNSRNNTVVWS